jgi:hypothetical protein
MLSAEDLDAGLAERYGWINRALPAISSQARRILRHAGEIVNHQLRSALVYQID